jgi:hypothetical protein
MIGGVGPGGITSDDLQWEREADELRHTGLKAARDAAAGWEKSIASVLGVFTVVAFIKGPEALKDLDDTVGVIVVVVVLSAAICAIVATVCAALASQGSVHKLQRLDGVALRDFNRDAAKKVGDLLWASRFMALLAAFLILVGMAVAWFSTVGGSSEASPAHVVLVSDKGTLSCGVLRTEDNSITLSPDGTAPGVPVPTVAQIVPVSACPK